MSDALITGADDRASGLFAQLADGDWAAVANEFNATMAAALPADKLAATWAQVVGMVGAYEGMGAPFARAQGDYSVVDVPLHFEAGEMKGRVSYDQQGQVAGLFILNPDVP
jgi:hypothetical protein